MRPVCLFQSRDHVFFHHGRTRIVRSAQKRHLCDASSHGWPRGLAVLDVVKNRREMATCCRYSVEPARTCLFCLVSPLERIHFQLNGPSDERREANAVMFQRIILKCTNTACVQLAELSSPANDVRSTGGEAEGLGFTHDAKPIG